MSCGELLAVKMLAENNQGRNCRTVKLSLVKMSVAKLLAAKLSVVKLSAVKLLGGVWACRMVKLSTAKLPRTVYWDLPVP